MPEKSDLGRFHLFRLFRQCSIWDLQEVLKAPPALVWTRGTNLCVADVDVVGAVTSAVDG